MCSLLFGRETKLHAHKRSKLYFENFNRQVLGGEKVSELKVANTRKLIFSVLLCYCDFDNLLSTFYSNIY